MLTEPAFKDTAMASPHISSSEFRPETAVEILTPSTVPVYLRDSEFGASLNYDDDEEFSVPIGVTKQTSEVNSTEDLSYLLATVRFWGVREVPVDILEFVFAAESRNVIAILNEYSAELRQLTIIAEALQPSADQSRMGIAMSRGYLELVQYLHTKGESLTEQCVKCAIHNGHAHCLEYALQQNIGFANAACTAAVNRTRICKPCIRVILQCCPDDTNRNPVCLWVYLSKRCTVCDAAACIGDIAFIQSARQRGVPCSKFTTTVAASNGQLDCLKYLHENGCRWGLYAVWAAVKNKHFNCAVYALANGAEVQSCPHSVLKRIIWSHHLECLHLLPANCFQGSGATPCYWAAKRGYIGCLVYLREQRNCAWDKTVTIAAAENGHYDCLWYAIQNGCPVDKHLCSVLTNKGGELHLLWFAQCNIAAHTLKIAICAAVHGYMNCLTHAVQQGCRKSVVVCNAAVATGRLDCLQYLCEQDFRYSGHTMQIAARNGHFDCVEYLLQQGLVADVRTCTHLAATGKLHLLQLALSQYGYGGVVSRRTRAKCAANRGGKCKKRKLGLNCRACTTLMLAAARHGQLACLQYLHEQLGFPGMDKVVSAAAVRKGQWECVKYLAQQGCDVAKRALRDRAV